jgi:hypothetical protein
MTIGAHKSVVLECKQHKMFAKSEFSSGILSGSRHSESSVCKLAYLGAGPTLVLQFLEWVHISNEYYVLITQ